MTGPVFFLPTFLTQPDAQALCAEVDPELHFPEVGGSTRDAKKICGRCELRDPCLEWALANEERWGVWGQTSEHERRKMRAHREREQLGRRQRPINHGTPGGYKAHRRRGEDACRPCLDALRIDHAERSA